MPRNIFDNLTPPEPDTPTGNIFGGQMGGPTMDRTASSNWRSDYTTPVYQQQAHAQNIFSSITANADATAADPAFKPYTTTSLPADHFTNTGGDPFSFLKPVQNVVGGAGQAFNNLMGGDPNAKDEPANIFGGQLNRGAMNLPFVGGALQGLSAIPNTLVGFGSLAPGAGQRTAVGAYLQGSKTLGGDEPGMFDLPSVVRGLSAASASRAATFGSIAQDPNAPGLERAGAAIAEKGIQAAPFLIPGPPLGALRGGLGSIFRKAPDVRVADRALPAPRAQLALTSGLDPRALPNAVESVTNASARTPLGRDWLASGAQSRGAFPIEGSIAAPSSQGSFWNSRGADVQAPLEGQFRELPRAVEPPATPTSIDVFRRQIAASVARQRSAPTPTEALGLNRAPANLRDARLQAQDAAVAPEPLPAPTFSSRVGALKPIGREDLTLSRNVARRSVPPVPIDELRSRIGAVDRTGVPLDAEQLAARIGSKTRPQADVSAQTSMALERAQAKATGTLGNSGMSGPLVGRAVGRGSSQLKRAGRTVEGLDATPGDLNASLVRQTKVHDANESAIAAMRAGDMPALERALRDVQLLGGDLGHTRSRIRAAGLDAPTAGELGATRRSRITLADMKLIGGGGANMTRFDAQAIRDARRNTRQGVDSFDTMVGDAGKVPPKITMDQLLGRARTLPGSATRVGMSAGDVAASRARLADRMGVNPTTGGAMRADQPIPGMPPKTSFADKVFSVVNLPKAIKASLDLSAPLRQGILLLPGHPGEFFGALKPMVQAMASEKFARELDNIIRSKDRPGLYIAPLEGKLSAREEAFVTNLADKIPGLAQSNRAYVTFLNKLRADVYDNTLAGWKAGGKTVKPSDVRGLSDVLNHFTGRGDLPSALEDIAPALNAAFFSPRFTISRFQSIGDAMGVLKSRDSLAARQAATDMVKFVGAGIGVLALAKLAGAQVEDDPRSSAFGKMQVGDTSVEIWGGFQPIARYTAQLITGQSKPISGAHAGEIIQAKRSDTLARYGESKLAPLPGAALGMLKGAPTKSAPGTIGQNFIGQPFTLADLFNPVPGQSSESLVTPLGWDDIVNAIEADQAAGGSGATGAALGATSLFGTGVQSIQRSTPSSAPARSAAPRVVPTRKPVPAAKRAG